MRYIAVLGGVLATLGLAGCNQQQKVEANSKAQQFKVQAQNAAARAKKDLTDTGIAFKVKQAMGASDKLNTSGIQVVTRDRVVHLRGTVVGADQKALAVRIAKDTVGKDVQVVDELMVANTAPSKPHSAGSK